MITDSLPRLARAAARDVYRAWMGREMSRASLRSALDAHWGSEGPALPALREPAFVDLVERELVALYDR